MIEALVARWKALSDADQVHAHGLALTGALFLVHFSLYSWWFIEDAAITFAFARNAALGEGLVAYAGGEPVEGFSNPSWTLLLAFLRLLGVSPFIGSKLAGAALGLATLGLGWAWSRRLMGPDAGRWPLLVPLLLATSPQHVLWCASGLENPLFGFLLALAALLLVREVEDGAPPWSALAWFGLAVTRPEAPMYVAIAGSLAFLLIAGRRGVRAALSWAWRWGLLLGVPFLAWHALRIGYFAWEFPNTYYAKLAEEDRFQPLKWDTRGWDYLRKWALWTTQGFLIPVYVVGQTGRGQGRGWAGVVLSLVVLLLLVPGLEWPHDLGVPEVDEPDWFMAIRVAGFATVALMAPGVGIERPGAPGRVLGWFLLATGLFFALYTGGDWMAGFRWISPVVVPLAVLFADGLREASQGLAAGRLRRIEPGIRLAVGAAPVIAGVVLAGTHVGGPETSPWDVRRRLVYMQGVAERLDLEGPTQMEVDMGAHVWWFGPVIDMAGLVDVPMAHHHWEKPFVAQYVYEERKPEFAHVHAYWAGKTHMTEHPQWRRDYMAIPDTPLSPNRTHTGNHVRRDLVFASRWAGGPERRVVFDDRLVLEGLDTPVPEVGAGDVLFVSLGWRRTGAGSPFRAWVFLAGPDRVAASWEIPPGYDWSRPVTWPAGAVVTDRHRLPLPDDLPAGTYDLGIVVAREGGEHGLVPPTAVPEGARTDAPRFATGEVRWEAAVTVLTAAAAERAVAEDVADALARAEATDCGGAEDAWQRVRHRLAWADPEVERARAALKAPMARCYARWAEALDPIDAVDTLVAARRWDHRDPVVHGVAEGIADVLVAEGDRARERGDAVAAYVAWRDALVVDPSRSWVRRRAEGARDEMLGLTGADPDGTWQAAEERASGLP